MAVHKTDGSEDTSIKTQFDMIDIIDLFSFILQMRRVEPG